MTTFFYSGQIRRFVTQFVRLMSNFQVQLGQNAEGISSLLRVPVYYGDSSRHVAAIIAKNSANNLPTVPAMTVYISGLRYDRPRIQEPQHVSKMQIRERAVDPVTGEYSNRQGDIVTVERLMPVPYILSLKVDIWTSNTDQKLQLIEQIAPLFNPSLEIQSSDSYIDWTSLSTVNLIEPTFSSRTVPVGPEDQIDVATFTFEIPIWLSAPAKVRKQGIIHKIIASVYDPATGLDNIHEYYDLQGSVIATRQIYTPINLNVVYMGNTLKLYVNDNQVEFSDGTVPAMREGNWELAVRSFGELAGVEPGSNLLQNGISQVRLENDGITVVGTVAYHPSDPSLLLYTVDTDTLPTNTLAPVNAIIDPHNVTVTPAISTPALHTRFLILNPIGDPGDSDGDPLTVDGPLLWNRPGEPELVAQQYDIIEWDGLKWVVAFNTLSTNALSTVYYVVNLTTGIQYKWKNNQWIKSVQGRYGVGAWSFVPNW